MVLFLDRRRRESMKITIATNQKLVDEGVIALMSNWRNSCRSIGLDIITKRTPSTKSSAPVLLQLTDGVHCLIILLKCFDILPESIYNFLSLPTFTFAGFGIKDTMFTLKKDYGLLCKNTLEVGPSGWHQSRTLSMTDTLTDMYIPDLDTISDVWGSERKLTGKMINLAISNAFAAFRLGNNILETY